MWDLQHSLTYAMHTFDETKLRKKMNNREDSNKTSITPLNQHPSSPCDSSATNPT